MSKAKTISLTIILTLIGAFVVYCLFLPPLNIRSEEFWVFIIGILVLVSVLLAIFSNVSGSIYKKATKISLASLSLAIAILVVFSVIDSAFFRAKSYSRLISNNITEHDFEDYNATMGNVPLLDKDSAMNIANRKLGGLQDVISQYEINDTEQITVRGVPVRVACLNHAGFFKWLTNKKNGTPGFIKVDMNTQEADLIRVEGGIKYTKSDYFLRNINRYLRFHYPTKIFWESTLELDEDDNPYWVTSIIDKTIGLFGGKEVSGVVLINAITGEHIEYALKEIPEWVDNVYGSSLLLDQYDSYGMYQKGFLNSLIGQKGVKRTTAGYNYIPQGDDNWIYTGITSVGKDESNIGFVLMNKRTKETHLYGISGAEEFSAMESAQGAVQHLGYRSTFPLLLKIENQPTYLVSLKDSGGLVKMYGMVNVEKYQIVATGNNIPDTLSEYKKLLRDAGASTSSSESKDIAGTVEDIRTATIDGNSIYFIKLKDKAGYYLLDILDNNKVSILNVGDNIKLNIEESDDDIISAKLK
ncbi:MAG TPA: CvpA family protein [Clostridia bacterium]|nr:CvpA family protein [Clostridia bacterium]